MRALRAIMLVAGGLLALAGPASAQAELCDAAARICVVNPPTAASPWVAPQLVQVRMPSEADPQYSGAYWTQSGNPEAEYPQGLKTGSYPIRGGLQLVQQGSPGGMSLYQGNIEPNFGSHHFGVDYLLPLDGALTLTVEAKASDSQCHCLATISSASFSALPILGAVGGFNWQIVRRGEWFSAEMTFDARTPIRLQQLFYVTRFTEGDFDIVRLFSVRKTTGTGPQRIVQKLSMHYVQSKCSGYRRCVLFSDGEFASALSGEQMVLLSGRMRPVVIHGSHLGK